MTLAFQCIILALSIKNKIKNLTMKKFKIPTLVSIIIFLLLFPFRLPISVLFINVITNIAELSGAIGENILAYNVAITKFVYDSVLCFLLGYTFISKAIAMETRKAERKGKKIDDIDLFGYYILTICVRLAYIIYDSVVTYQLYFELKG